MPAPPQPPRMTGDPQRDFVSMVQWANDFYRAVVLENAYADQIEVASTLEDLTDPADGTVATAQETANSALLLAQDVDSRLEPVEDDYNNEVSGEVTISDTDTTATITLPSTQPDTSYYVTYGGVDYTGTPPAAAFIVVKTYNKATGQFDIGLASAPGAGNSITLSWSLHRNPA